MTDTPPELPPRVQRLITSADGYIDLKMADYAAEDLDQIPSEHHTTLHYRWVTCRLCMLREQWDQARLISEEICAEKPDEAASWVTLAYTTRRAVGLLEAKSILLEAMPRFPGDGVFPYNLACYACQCGELDAAREYLRVAFSKSDEFRSLALQDEDLEPLHAELPH